jgi:hypothetical protein
VPSLIEHERFVLLRTKVVDKARPRDSQHSGGFNLPSQADIRGYYFKYPLRHY